MSLVKIEMTEDCVERLKRYIKAKKITADDLKVIKLWYQEMERLGPDHIVSSRNWADHELNRNWKGHRASKFSKSGRIIYKIIEDKIEICEIQRITPDHDYENES